MSSSERGRPGGAMRRNVLPTSGWVALAIAGLGVWMWTASAQAAEIKVLSAGAVKGIVTELAETFRQETGHTVTITPGTAGELRQKVEAGEPADVVIVTDTVLEQLAGQRLVVADTRADLARTGIGVAVRDGAPLPDISTAEAIVKGQAELCVHQISEILPVKGVKLVGPLPRELQKITTYSAAVATRAATPETARAFIAFVTRPTFKPKFVVAGLDYRE